MANTRDPLLGAPTGTLRERSLWTLTQQDVSKIDSIINKRSMSNMDAIVSEIQFVKFGFFLCSVTAMINLLTPSTFVHQILYNTYSRIRLYKVFRLEQDGNPNSQPLHLFSESILPNILQLPTEMLQSLVDNICATPNADVRIALSLAILALPEPRQHDLTISIEYPDLPTLDILAKWFPRVGGGLHTFAADIDDEYLMLLSSSPSARTIKSLDLRQSRITDSSSTAWSRFSAVECVNVTLCEYIGFETVRSISWIPTLRIFSVGNLDCGLTLKNCEELFGSDRLPHLEELEFWELSHLFRENKEGKQRMLQIFSNRAKTLTRLSKDLRDELSVDEIVAFHAALPHLAQFLRNPKTLTELLRSLPFSNNLRYLSLLNVYEPLSKELFNQIATSCPLLETLLIDADEQDGSTFLGDLSIFSSLQKLELSCSSIYKMNKFPQSLVHLDLREAGGTSEEAQPSQQSLEQLMASLCSLTNLRYLRLFCQAPVITIASFNALARRLTKLEKLTLFQSAPAAAEKTQVPLMTMPHLRQVYISVINLALDPAKIYLPALRSTEYCSVPWGIKREQLPNLSYINFSDLSKEEQASLDAAFFQNFGPQLTGIADPPDHLSIPQLATFSNLDYLKISSPITCSDAAALLQNLPKLQMFFSTVTIADTDFKWLAHSKLNTLILRLRATTANIEITSARMPFIKTVSLAFEDCESAQVRLLNLKHLDDVMFQSSESKSRMALEIADCGIEAASLRSIDVDSLKISNVPFFQLIDVESVSLPTDDSLIQIRGAPRLSGITPSNEDMEEVCARLRTLISN